MLNKLLTSIRNSLRGADRQVLPTLEPPPVQGVTSRYYVVCVEYSTVDEYGAINAKTPGEALATVIHGEFDSLIKQSAWSRYYIAATVHLDDGNKSPGLLFTLNSDGSVRKVEDLPKKED